MEHKLIQGGEQWLPFARSRIKALKALGGKYATQRFTMPDGATVMVQLVGGIERIEIKGGGGSISFVAGVAYPTTLENKYKVLSGKITVRTGRTPEYGNKVGSVSPFSNKNIVFGPHNPFTGFYQAYIDGTEVVNAAVNNPYISWQNYAFSTSDNAAVLYSNGRASGINAFDQDLVAHVVEYVRDGAGDKVVGVGGEYSLEVRNVAFDSLPYSTGSDYFVAVFDKAGKLFVLALENAVGVTVPPGVYDHTDNKYSISLYAGAGAATESVLDFMQDFPAGQFSQSVSWMAAGESELAIGFYTDASSLAGAGNRGLWVSVYDYTTGPFVVTHKRTFEVQTFAPGTITALDFMKFDQSAVAMHGGIVWCRGMCINVVSGKKAFYPNNPILIVQPNYMAVSADGRTATLYYAFLSNDNMDGRIDVSAMRTSFEVHGPLTWPWTYPTVGSPPLSFEVGSVVTLKLTTDENGDMTVTDVTPVDPAKTEILGTKWVYRSTDPSNYGAALQFAKPAGTK